MIKFEKNIDFAGKFKLFGIISSAVVIISLVMFFAVGLNYEIGRAHV